MLKMMLQTIGRRIESRSEPTIKDMLSDSIVRAVMEADGIDPRVLEVELNGLADDMSARCMHAQGLSAATLRHGGA